MKLALCALVTLLPRSVDGLIACAYRCDPSWAGLDTGKCIDADSCPSPDSSEVENVICWGLPFQPGPGDILLHDMVPFDTQDDCNAYLDSWKSDGQRNAMQTSGNSSAAGSDKTSFPDRGQIWSTAFDVIKECVSVPECQQLVKGATGKEVQDCLNKCAFEYGEDRFEEWMCKSASMEYTGGLVNWFCDHALSYVMEPVNKFLNKFIEEPVVKVAETIEDAVASVGKKIASFFHFSLWEKQLPMPQHEGVVV
eukprot:TRINITY_DN88247_c0_g1_i1.p1 TRINITY_DN88247_c0_g1~~TRINITY_DN88247_c0_g1_i1.p1  ORF type:complete len:252 (+),score=49.27 TRINITY_DN88247_c0_g1_i1:66-821(+)